MQKKVLAICEDGTNRSVLLCKFLKERGIECIPAGHSDLAKEFGRHYSQIDGRFDYVILLDDKILLEKADKIAEIITELYLKEDAYPFSWVSIDEDNKNYKKILKDLAKTISELLEGE